MNDYESNGEVTREGSKVSREPPVDYSKDPDNATPMKFTKMTERLSAALMTLDAHIDTNMQTIDAAVGRIAASIDERFANNTASAVRARRLLAATIAVCALACLVSLGTLGYIVYLGGWREGQRDRIDEVLRQVRPHDAAVEMGR